MWPAYYSLGIPAWYPLQKTNRNMSHVTASKIDYHMTQLTPNNKPLHQLFIYI